jgi:hypothetical protein
VLLAIKSSFLRALRVLRGESFSIPFPVEPSIKIVTLLSRQDAKFGIVFFTFAPLRPFDVAQDMLCARYSEFR